MDGGATFSPALPASTKAERPEWADRAREMLAQDFWTAAELQSLGLRELPSDRWRIHEWLKREKVLAEAVSGNGGVTYRYNLYSMPSALRQAIASRLVPYCYAGELPSAETEARVADLRALEGLPPGQTLRAQARAAVVHAWMRWESAAGLLGQRGATRFSDLWAAGSIQAPAWLREELPSFCAKSLLIWRRQLQTDGLRALAGAYKPKVSRLDAHEDWARSALGLVARYPTIEASKIHEFVSNEAEDAGLTPPSLRGVQRWLKKWLADNRLTHAVLRNPDAARSRLMPAFGDAGASAGGFNAVWEMDTTPTDLVLSDGRRWTIIGIIDVWSRDAVLRLAEVTSGHNARLAFRDGLLHLGVPQLLRTDNGSDLRNRQTEVLLGALDIALPHMPVGRPDLKPFIERFLQTVNYDLVPLLPAYAGHNVADAQALRSRRSFMQQMFQRGGVVELPLSPAEMQAFLDTWLQGYRNRVHAGLKTSPAMRRAAWSGPVRKIEDARALDILLAPLAGGNGIRTVEKKGIRADGGTFSAPALGALVGERVLCRQDPADAGRIYVFSEDGRFLCVAEDWRLTGTDPQELAMAAKAAWREAVKTGTAELRTRGKAIDRGALAVELANRRAARGASVVAFPKPVQPHSTPALEQHGRAARADEAMPAPARSAADAQRAAWLADKAAREVARATENSREAQAQRRVAEAMAIRDALAAGLPVEPAQAEWFDGYRTTGEFRQALRARGIDPNTGRPLFADGGSSS